MRKRQRGGKRCLPFDYKKVDVETAPRSGTRLHVHRCGTRDAEAVVASEFPASRVFSFLDQELRLVNSSLAGEC